MRGPVIIAVDNRDDARLVVAGLIPTETDLLTVEI